MQRIFFSPTHECKANCLYCFAKWNGQYTKHTPLFENITIHENCIIYPFCDSDADFDDRFFRIANEVLKIRHTCISISVKSNIEDAILSKISCLNKSHAHNDSFIKISVSIAAKDTIKEIEKGTLSYQDRIILLRKIFDFGIPSSVLIKPILPFISFCEYERIIDDTEFLGSYVIGDLYVDTDSHFFKAYIKDKFRIACRPVRWLDGHPNWAFVVQDERIRKLQELILSKNLRVFDSDVDFIKALSSKE